MTKVEKATGDNYTATALVEAKLASETIVKLGIAIIVPIILYFALAVITKPYR